MLCLDCGCVDVRAVIGWWDDFVIWVLCWGNWVRVHSRATALFLRADENDGSLNYNVYGVKQCEHS